MTDQLPLVSVVIPCYNHAQYVQESIQSVIDQDYNNIELIIIDDGSKDNSVVKIQEMISACEARFNRFAFRHRPNKGLSATLNEALEWCEGKYFSALASDDIKFSTKISILVARLENADEIYAVAFGDAIFIDNNGDEIYKYKISKVNSNKKNRSKQFLKYYTFDRGFCYKDDSLFGSYKSLLAGNYLPAMSSVIKIKKIREVGGWTNGNTIEDWEMWLKLSKKNKFLYVDESVSYYRLHDTNSSLSMTFELAMDGLMLLENEKEYALKNGYSLVWYSSLVNLVISLFFFNKILFFKKFLKYSVNPLFMYKLIQKIFIKFLGLLK